MGAPKQKWTSEEEGALRAGVQKYGAGRWRTIQKDPEFGVFLAARSNVDLKDKWRNMSVSNGQGIRERVKTSKKLIAAVPFQSLNPEATTSLLAIEAGPSSNHENLGSSKVSTNGRTAIPRYDDMIIEALTALRDPNGSDVATIASFIEERHEVPSNFKRLLGSKLRRLVSQDKIVKSRHNYKLKDNSSIADMNSVLEATSPPDGSIQHSMDDSIRRINEASMFAAMKMADAEALSAMADEAVQEAEYAARMAEDADMYCEAASAVFDKLLRDGVVILA